jgi:hypothetical protein
MNYRELLNVNTGGIFVAATWNVMYRDKLCVEVRIKNDTRTFIYL